MSLDLFKGGGAAGGNGKRGGPQRRNIKEKNYFYIKNNQLPGIAITEPAGGKPYFGKLQLTVTALQDIHVGSGDLHEESMRLYEGFSYYKNDPRDPKRVFTLPGSTMKGCILTHLLMFLRDSATGFYNAGTRRDSDPMVKVFFSDFPIVAGGEPKPRTIAGRFNPRIHPPADAVLKMYLKDDPAHDDISRADWQALPAKENILTIKKGARFSGFVNFNSLSLQQLLFLVLSLGCLPGHRYCFKIGGARNRGMGLVSMSLARDSIFAGRLMELVFGNHRPFADVLPQLAMELETFKRRYKNIETVLGIMRRQYGVPS